MNTHAIKATVFFAAAIVTLVIHKLTDHPPYKEAALMTVSTLCLILGFAEGFCAGRQK